LFEQKLLWNDKFLYSISLQMNKFPRVVNKKWKRYTKLEKVFILFLVVLLFLEFFLPFISIE
jgi:cell division protein FtsL